MLSTPHLRAAGRCPAALVALTLCLGLGLGLAGCGKPSLAEELVGMYATESVQADLQEHERAFFGDDLHARFDSVDRDEAEQEGLVWARLRLHADGRFEYEGPAADEAAADARLRGRWSARDATLRLVIEKAKGSETDGLPPTLACPATRSAIELPFLTDPKTGRPVRLARR